mgnify:CR=1 FL=1
MSKNIPTNRQEYTAIAIYSGTNDGDTAISSFDGTPGYLHIHIIRKDILASLPVLEASPVNNSNDVSTIHQWGSILDKNLSIREPLVTVQEIISYGNIGIGSAGMGGKEETSSFAGGGEVFIIPCLEGVKAFRITKGQGVFPLNLDDKCWTCEVTDNKESLVTSTGSPKISSRLELLEFLQEKHGQNKDLPFVAQFDAHFEKEHLAVRSNGLWSHDELYLKHQNLIQLEDIY